MPKDVKALVAALEDAIEVGRIALTWCPERDKFRCYMDKLDADRLILTRFKEPDGADLYDDWLETENWEADQAIHFPPEE